MTLDITKYSFPTVTAVESVFPTFDAPADLLAEAEERGFLHGATPYNRLFSSLFFSGGTLEYKAGLDPDFVQAASSYLQALMVSFAPKHEHKEAVCALILSELVDPSGSKGEAA